MVCVLDQVTVNAVLASSYFAFVHTCSGWSCALPGNGNRLRRTSTVPTRTIECLVSQWLRHLSFRDVP